MKMFKLLLIGLALSALSFEARAQNITVTQAANDANDTDCTDNVCSLQGALDTAKNNSEDDEISIQAGTYSAGVTTFSYSTTKGNSLKIIGQSNQQVVLTGSVGQRILDLTSTSQLNSFTLEVSNLTFNAGGGIAMGSFNSTLILKNNILKNNFAGYSGVAASVSSFGGGSDIQITNNVFDNNVNSSNFNAGLNIAYLNGGSLPPPVKIANNTFINNRATTTGATLRANSLLTDNGGVPVQLNLYNNIFRSSDVAHPLAQIDDGSSANGNGVTISHNVIDVSKLITTCKPAIGCTPALVFDANADFDPQLDSTYHLGQNSLAINAGANNVPGGNPSDDFERDARNDGQIDIGADEFLPRPAVQIAPASNNFQTVLFGSSATKEFTLTNSGSASLQVTGISLPPPNFSLNVAGVLNACDIANLPFNLTPTQSCKFEVVFSPTAEGVLNANLTIASNAQTSPTVSLTGTGQSCGNGTLDGNDECDDAQNPPVSGDGCSESCKVETGFTCNGAPSTCASICGDGLVIGGEACDDGNLNNDDGCSSTCTIDPGYACSNLPQQPSVCTSGCGNGVLFGSEQCDDGNQVDNDGCNHLCQTPACGNGVVDQFETCDEGNQVTEACVYGATSCQVCNAQCQSVAGATSLCGDSTCDATHEDSASCPADCPAQPPTATCGNGVKETGEACDGTDLGGATCALVDSSFKSGTLSCDASCELVTTACSTTDPNQNPDTGTSNGGCQLVPNGTFPSHYAFALLAPSLVALIAMRKKRVF